MGVASTSEHRSFYNYEYGTCATSSMCTGPGTPLSSVSVLAYSTYRDASSTTPNVVPSLNIEIDPDSTTTSGVDYATLVWEPVGNGLTVSTGAWQSWDAYNGGAGLWYSTADLSGYGVLECAPMTCSATWSDIVSNLPDGIIKYGLGPNVGSGWSGFNGNVDDLAVGIGSDTKVFDFEQPPHVTVGDATIYEGDVGRRTARVMVTLDQAAPAGGVTVWWTTTPGTATNNVDFRARSGRLYFKYRQTTRYASISVKGDTAVEGNETFNVVVSGVAGATVTDGTGVVTIVDENGGSPASLSISSAHVYEGHSGGSRYVLLPVTLRGKATTPVTVYYTTSSGTATAPDDYLGRTGSVTFKVKSTKRQVLIYLAADQVAEGNETFDVTLYSPVGATIVNGTGTVTIVDDD